MVRKDTLNLSNRSVVNLLELKMLENFIMSDLSPLQKMRLHYQPMLPKILQDIGSLIAVPRHDRTAGTHFHPELATFFPKTLAQPFLTFTTAKNTGHGSKRVGVVFSGGPASGGHNVIAGLFDALKKLHPDSRLFGFLDGPNGILKNISIEITADLLSSYRNQGGFDLIGSGRTKIETPEQFQVAESTCRTLKLDGLVIIGGDDSNTNAALLAEYFLHNDCQTGVIGVPKTIDGDLKNQDIEISFGFDTATKTFSEIIGNILQDTLSSKKYYYFIKLMGRSASHVTLECALQTHPNLALINEEVEAQGKTLFQITEDICDLIVKRAELGKNYGVILIPEGIIEFIPEFKQLIRELNRLLETAKPHKSKLEAMSTTKEKITYAIALLSEVSANCFKSIPEEISLQLLLDRDPHGNVQVSQIASERLFIEMVKAELKSRQAKGTYSGKFNPQGHFCGYEGRSGLPSNFDAQYCYVLGHAAALLIDEQATGYICCVQHLAQPVEKWQIGGCNLANLMVLEQRHGKEKPVIGKALVDLHGKPMESFKAMREKWKLQDDYCCPGPIQFFGPPDLTDAHTITLQLERED